MQQERRGVAENAVVDVRIFNDGVRVVPFAVYDEAYSYDGREEEDIAERGQWKWRGRGHAARSAVPAAEAISNFSRVGPLLKQMFISSFKQESNLHSIPMIAKYPHLKSVTLVFFRNDRGVFMRW